jgi:ABC-type proline/glycine betaine transport system permease subunit
MAQPDAPAPPKLNLKTLIIGFVIAAIGGGGYAGIDAAGYTPDSEALKALGIGGALALIAYIHYVALPRVLAALAPLEQVNARLQRIEVAVGVAPPVAAAAVELPPVPDAVPKVAASPAKSGAVLRLATAPPVKE